MNNQSSRQADKPIGVFDSGVGGLSILASVKKLLPKESFVYLADQKNNPYGGRSVDEIKELSSKVIDFLIDRKVKLVIVACNTVSVNAIDYLRSKFNIPIIAVVPVVKTISEKTKTGEVLVLSTPATAKSQYLKDLINKFSNGKKVHVVGTSKLEHLVEKGMISGSKVKSAIEESLSILKNSNIDSIALGCTHYPFLIKEIQKIVGPKVKIYDSGGAIARRTEAVLENENLLSEKSKGDVFYTTGDIEEFKRVSKKLLGRKLRDLVNTAQSVPLK